LLLPSVDSHKGLLYFGPLEEFINFAFREEVPVDPLPHLTQSSRSVKFGLLRTLIISLVHLCNHH